MNKRPFSLDDLAILIYGLDEDEFLAIDVHAKVKTQINSKEIMQSIRQKSFVHDLFVSGKIIYQIFAWKNPEEQQLRKRIAEEQFSYAWRADVERVKNSSEDEGTYVTQGAKTTVPFYYVLPYELAVLATSRKREILKLYSSLNIIPRYVYINGKKIMGEEYSLEGYIVRATNLAKVQLGMMGTCVVPMKGIF